jgi:hypothetical protein
MHRLLHYLFILKKVYCEMIGMGAKSITIVRAVTAEFFFDCRAAEVPSDE